MSSNECRQCGRSAEEAANERIEKCERLDPSDFGVLVKQSRQLLEDRGFCSQSCQNRFRREVSDFDPEDPRVEFRPAGDFDR